MLDQLVAHHPGLSVWILDSFDLNSDCREMMNHCQQIPGILLSLSFNGKDNLGWDMGRIRHFETFQNPNNEICCISRPLSKVK